MKSPIFKNTDIRFGFEIECVITGARFSCGKHTTKWKVFKNAVECLNPEIKIGTDYSIRCDDFDEAVELRTPPLPSKKDMDLLKKIFDIINLYGHTNRSCGFHVNLSSIKKSNMKKFNPLSFICSNLWNQILSSFDRKNNSFCLPLPRKYNTNLHKINGWLRLTYEKYRCVSFRSFGNGMGKCSRIEIRGFGNKNYTKKFNTIAVFVKKIERLFIFSCNQPVRFKSIQF